MANPNDVFEWHLGLDGRWYPVRRLMIADNSAEQLYDDQSTQRAIEAFKLGRVRPIGDVINELRSEE